MSPMPKGLPPIVAPVSAVPSGRNACSAPPSWLATQIVPFEATLTPIGSAPVA